MNYNCCMLRSHSGNISYKKVMFLMILWDPRQFRDKIRTGQIVGQNSGCNVNITSCRCAIAICNFYQLLVCSLEISLRCIRQLSDSPPFLYSRLYRRSKVLMYSVPGFQLLKIDPFWRRTPKFQLEIRTGTALIFSESTATSISFAIQISKSIFSQTKANTVE